MNSPFRPKTLNLPGVLSDDAMGEYLKQFANQKNALQDAAPPPSSAIDFADSIKREWLDNPPPALLKAQRPSAPAPEPDATATKQWQEKATDVRSGVLSSAAELVPEPLRSTILGPAIGLVGEGGPLSALGTLDTPEARQEEAEKRAVDAAEGEAAVRTHAEMRDKLRNLTDEDAAALGMPSAPGAEEVKPELAARDAKVVADVGTKRKEAVAALSDPTKQPTQKWWLDAAQATVKGAYDVPLSMLRLAPIVYDTTRDLMSQTSNEKSSARLWADTVDATLTKMLPGDKTRSKDFIHELAAGSGSMLGFMLSGYVGAAAGLTGKVATMVAGASVGAVEQFEDAEAHKATTLQKAFALFAGGTIGLTEAVPIDRMMRVLDASSGGVVSRMIANTAAGSMEEFIQELGQSFGNDVVAKVSYDVKRDLDLNKYIKAGLMGAITGGLAGGAASILQESGVTGQVAPEGYVPVTPVEREAAAMTVIDALDQQFEALPGLAESVDQTEAERVLGDFTIVDPADVNLAPFPTSEKFTVVDPADDVTNTPAGEFDGAEVTLAADQENVPAGMRRVIAPGGVEKIIGEDLLTPVVAPAQDLAANIQPTEDTTTATRVVEGPGGAIPVNESGKFEITHGSRLALDVIDPAKRGTGPLKGEERKRLGSPGNGDPNVVDRAYYGVGDPNFGDNLAAANAKLPPRKKIMRNRTDPYFGENLGPFRHTVEVDPATIYNWDQDPLNLKSKLDRTLAASEQVTQYERFIKDAGFKGAYRSSTGLGQVAMLFEPATPSRVVHQRYNLPPKEVATPEDFRAPTAKTFSEKGGWAVITATQEAVGPATDPENIAANEKLRKELKRNGIQYQEVGGTYQGVDQGKSFMVFMPEAEAVKLGQKYKQESVLTRKGLEYADGRLVPAVPAQTVTGEAARKNDFFSTLPNGEAFSVGLDFDDMREAGDTDLLAMRASVVDVGPITGTGKNGQIKVVDIGKAMTSDHEARMGRQLYPETDDGDYEIVLDLARVELADQLTRANSGVGWYGKDVEEAVTTTARMFPTLLTEPSHRQLYLTYAGIFSNGATPEQAWMMSAEAFGYFLETGRSPVKRVRPDGTPTKLNAEGKAAGWSVRTAANEQQLALVNYLVEREGGLEQAMTWLTSMQPRTAINAAMIESGLYKEGRFTTKATQAGKTFGALAFGEKLGRYTLGLHGVPLDAGDTTVDLWYTRTFRRWTGRLMEAPISAEGIAGGVNSDAERQVIFRLTGDLVKENPGLTAGDVQAVLWFFEKRLWGDHGIRTEEGSNSSGARKLVSSLPNDGGRGAREGVRAAAEDDVLANRGTGNPASFIEAEQVITRYTKGELTPAQARKELAAMGWQVGPEGFKKQNSPIELIDPNGDAEWTYGNRGTGNRAPLKGEQTRPDQGIATPPDAQVDDGVVDITLQKMSMDVVKLLDATARQGRLTIKGKGVLGQYSRKQAVMRIKTMSDLSTVVHEGGHALYFDAGPALAKVFTDNEAAVMQAGRDLYGGDVNLLSKADHIAEGVAEFFRVFTLNRGWAEAKYPQLTADFKAALQTGAPTLLAGLELTGKKFNAWLQLPSAQLVKNKIVTGKRDTKFEATLKEIQDAGFPTWMREIARKSLETFVDRYAGVREVVTQLKNIGEKNQGSALDVKYAEDPYVLSRMAGSSGARAMIELSDGVHGYHSTQSSTRGLREALLRYHGLAANKNIGTIDPVRQQDFAAYLVALRGVDEYRRLDEKKLDRPPFDDLTLGDLHKTILEMEAKYGADFVEAASIVNEFASALWKKSFDAGLMSKETYTNGLDRQFYAPLQRDMSDKKKTLGTSALTGGTSIVKRFRGSGRDIIDPMDALMHKTFALEKIIAKNDAVKALATLAERAGKAGALVERVPANQMIGRQWSVKEVARQLTKDPHISETEAQDMMEILQASIEDDSLINLFKSEQASTKGENIVFYWDSGRLAALQLSDGELGADVTNVINGMGRENLPLFVEMVAATSTAFRTAITSWPDFLMVNFVRDQLSTWILNDVGYIPFVTGIKGTMDEFLQRRWAKQYNAAMGIMGGMNVAELHRARLDRDIGALLPQGYTATAFSEGGFLGAARGMARLAELTETGTRVGLFQKAFERAKADGLNDYEASLEAGYIATDNMPFDLNGSRMLLFRRTIPFLNAQLQGLYKMVRTLGADEVRQRKGLNFVLRAYLKSTKGMDLSRTEKMAINTGRKAWAKMISLGMLSAALHFLFEDDPDYQNASEYLRTTGWVIPLGNGEIFYIPKPFELAVFANFVERGLEHASGDAEAKNRFMRGLAFNLVPPASPPALQTAVELTANYDFFSGREIVPSYMKVLEDTPELQFNNYTSELAKGLGAALQAANIPLVSKSPMVLDHILGNLGASAYRDITTMTNQLNPNERSLGITDMPIARRFFRDSRRGSTVQQDFWKMASTLNGKLASASQGYERYIDAGNEAAANALLARLDEDERAFALLDTHFKPEAKHLHPYYRGRRLMTVVSEIRREIGSDEPLTDTTTKFAGEIKLTAREKRDLDSALSEYATREMRNTLVVMGAPGWANKQPMDTQATIELIRATNPDVAAELERRVKKAKVYSFDTVNSYWPEVKDRLLRDRENTFLKDILTIAKVTQ